MMQLNYLPLGDAVNPDYKRSLESLPNYQPAILLSISERVARRTQRPNLLGISAFR